MRIELSWSDEEIKRFNKDSPSRLSPAVTVYGLSINNLHNPTLMDIFKAFQREMDALQQRIDKIE
jgi:hypothetical protein